MNDKMHFLGKKAQQNYELFFLVECPDLLDPDTGVGYWSLGKDGAFATATLTCGQGYSLQGTKLLYCLRNGSWDSELPICGTNI